MDNVQENHWWSSILYKDAKTFIKENLSNMARSYIAVGYYLRSIRENEGYKEDGYQNVHELAEAEFGMKRQTVDHCIRVNKKFSKDGESPVVAEEYREFKKAQLQEMLYLTDDQILEVNPEMSVRQIREIRKGEEEKKEPIQLSEAEEIHHFTKELGVDQAYGWTWNELVKAFHVARRDRPEGLVYRIPLFGKEYIVLEKENVVEFKNEDGRVLFDVENERINSEYACWLKGNEKKECSTSSISETEKNAPAEVIDIECEEIDFSEAITLEQVLKEEIRKLEEWYLALKEDGCETDAFYEKQKIIVAALSLMAEQKEEKEGNQEQPELPKLKNKRQREEWLENYKAWPVWTKNEVIEETLYRYDLPDGYAFVVRHYLFTILWKNKEEERQDYYLLPPDYKHLAEHSANVTEMVRHLQEMQKGKGEK